LATSPIIVTLPNGDTISSTHEATLPFPDLPRHALTAHIFPDLHGHALLSIGTFCDAGCTAIFSATEVAINFQGKTVLKGTRQPPGLWKTTQQPTTTMVSSIGMANGAFSNQLKSNALKFLHAACFSPTTATWTKAINHGFFCSWPMLTAKTVRQHLPKSVATAMGHMDQSRKNQRSTKLRSKQTQDDDGWITPAPRRTKPQRQQDLEPQQVTGTNDEEKYPIKDNKNKSDSGEIGAVGHGSGGHNNDGPELLLSALSFPKTLKLLEDPNIWFGLAANASESRRPNNSCRFTIEVPRLFIGTLRAFPRGEPSVSGLELCSRTDTATNTNDPRHGLDIRSHHGKQSL
jgi:hypothetical protein